QASLDAGAGEFALTDLRLDAGGLRAAATLHGQGLGKTPTVAGKLSVAEFDPRQVLAGLGLPAPRLQGEQTLHKAALELHFAGTPDSARISDMRLVLDDSVFSGKASVDNFTTPTVAFNASANTFNLDHYLPAAQAGGSKPAAGGERDADASAATPIDLSFLRRLTLDGKLQAGTLTAYGMTFNDAALALTARDGVLTIKPLASGFYDGSINVVANIDASG